MIEPTKAASAMTGFLLANIKPILLFALTGALIGLSHAGRPLPERKA
jgi:hypothetical protein